MVNKISTRGVHYAMKDTRMFSMWVYALPALLSYGVVMPLFCYSQEIDSFSHGFTVLMMGVLPVITSMLVKDCYCANLAKLVIFLCGIGLQLL